MGIPFDFEKLVNIVEETWDKPKLITDDNALWYNFVGLCFLMGT
jgi:hypothetical protein